LLDFDRELKDKSVSAMTNYQEVTMFVYKVEFPYVPEAGALYVEKLEEALPTIRTMLGGEDDEVLNDGYLGMPLAISIEVIEMPEEEFKALEPWEF
jgi:hypothetical protein